VNALSCPALLVSGCASGQGKTTVTAALARYHSRAGRRVRVFKTGPDFIDPMVLEIASAAPVYNLDCWMVGIEASQALLAVAANEADLILVEGAMGLYDGEPSTADLAATFGLPVVVVIDANAMAQTFGAVAKGLKEYRPVPFAGVIANRVAGSQHAHMLAQSLPPDIELIAALSETANSLPERHLGLVQAVELTGLPVILDELADLLEESGYTRLPPPVAFASTTGCTPDRLLEHYRVAVARDAAFSFLYRANLDCLAAMGAELVFFSPLANEPVPPADADGLQERASSRNRLARHRLDAADVAVDAGAAAFRLLRVPARRAPRPKPRWSNSCGPIALARCSEWSLRSQPCLALPLRCRGRCSPRSGPGTGRARPGSWGWTRRSRRS